VWWGRADDEILLGDQLVGLAVQKRNKSWTVAAGVLFVVTYVLDNCDGEIARLKDQCSTFGMWFDTFVDWIVHTAFFIALGIGTAKGFGHDAWLWLGWIAAAGGTFNFVLGIILDARDKAASEDEDKAKNDARAEP